MPATLENVFAKPFKNGKLAASKKVDNNTYAELRIAATTPDGEQLISATPARWLEADEHRRAVAIRLHQTDVVTWVADGRIILHTGGWKSVTTKARINDWLPVGWFVSSVKGEWRVYRRDYPVGQHGGTETQSYPFADGFVIKQLSMLTFYAVEGTYPSESEEKLLRDAKAKLRKDIKAYVAKLDTAVPAWQAKVREEGRLSTAGDCMYCQGIVTTMDGEVAQNVDHLWLHMREGYVFPTILVNAYRLKGWARPDGAVANHIGMGLTDMLKKQLAAYLLKVLGASSEPSAATLGASKLEAYVPFAVQALERPGDFGYFGGDETLWNTSAPTWTKHRDSDNHELANFEVVWNTLAAEFPELIAPDLDEDRHADRDFNPAAPGAIYVFGAGHWAVGHIDQIVVPVKLDASRPVAADNLHPAFIRVCDLQTATTAYPLLEGAEDIVDRLDAADRRSEARQYLEEPTDEQVDQLVAAVLNAHAGEWPEFMEAEGWRAVVVDAGLTPASWLDRYAPA